MLERKRDSPCGKSEKHYNKEKVKLCNPSAYVLSLNSKFINVNVL